MDKARTGSGRWWKLLLLALAVGILATLATGLWNLRNPLSPEQFQEFRQLWKKQGPATYTLTYVTKTQDNEKGNRFVVKVQDGKVVEAVCNGQAEPPERFGYYGMDRLFDYIEDFYQLDLKTKERSNRPFYRGTFDSRTGALRWFARRLLGERQWVEITVEKLE